MPTLHKDRQLYPISGLHTKIGLIRSNQSRSTNTSTIGRRGADHILHRIEDLNRQVQPRRTRLCGRSATASAGGPGHIGLYPRKETRGLRDSSRNRLP